MNNKFDNYYRQLGLNIAYYRKLRNLNQLQLAEKIDISRTHLSNIEAPNVPTSISLDTLFKIADALNISPTELMQFHDLPDCDTKSEHPNR